MTSSFGRLLSIALVGVRVGVGLVVPSSCVAAEFAAAIGKKGYGRCHQGSCSFFIIHSAVPVGNGRDGTLYAVAQDQWSAVYKPTDTGAEYRRPPIHVDKREPALNLVYCSKTRPIVFYFGDGKWLASRLRPGDDGAIFGANESDYQYYFAACHDSIVQQPNPKGLARRLGYDFKQTDGSATDIDDPITPKDVLMDARGDRIR